MSDPLSSTEGSGGVTATAPLHSYGEKFEELFPYYLSLGMTEEQYWDKDCRLVIFYRKAEELRTSRKNQERRMGDFPLLSEERNLQFPIGVFLLCQAGM